MTQAIPVTKTIVPNINNPAEIINSISAYMDKNHCENLEIDISFINIFDACKISAVCSAKHFTKYPNGNISWKVASEKIIEFNKDLNIGNSTYIL